MSSVFTTISEKHPRPINLKWWQLTALNLSQCFPQNSLASRKILRAIYGKKLKHMSNTGAPFRLSPSPSPQVLGIYWRGKKLGETIPFPEKTATSTLWLLATGPSVNNIDLTQLRGRCVMGVNGASSLCEKHQIRPQYYASTDPDFFENRMNLIRQAIESGAHCFFSANGISRICELAPELLRNARISLLETVNRFWGLPQLSPAELFSQAAADSDLILPDEAQHKVGWSNNPHKGVFASNTVTYSACQLGAAMGFSRINILGMDLGADKSGAVRAYEQGPTARPSKLEESYHVSILPAFETMSSLPLTTKFYNLSPNSRLPEDVIPKVSYEAALAEDALTNG